MSGAQVINSFWRRPAYLPADEVRGLDAGIPRVEAKGKEKTWEGMPADSKLACEFLAKGTVWFPQKGVRSRLFTALTDATQTPKLLSGVENSRDVTLVEDSEPGVLSHVLSLQAGLDFQYLSRIVARDLRYGVVFEQKLVSLDGWVPAEDLFLDEKTGAPKRTDTLKEFEGRIEILEIANGTVIVMEFSALIANVHAPNCDLAAGSHTVSDYVPSFIGGDRAVKRQIEARLKNLYKKAIATDLK